MFSDDEDDTDTAGEQRLGPNAIGVLHWNTSLDSRSEANQLKTMATEHDLFLIETVMFDQRPPVAALLLAQHIGDAEAVAVLTPGLEHVGDLKQSITLLCDLVTADEIYPRGYCWPAAETATGGGD